MKVEAIDHVHIMVKSIRKAMRLLDVLSGFEYPEPMAYEDHGYQFGFLKERSDDI